MISASIKSDDTVLEYITDPQELFEQYENIVDIVIDGGAGDNIASTIIDYTEDEPLIVREGKGDINKL